MSTYASVCLQVHYTCISYRFEKFLVQIVRDYRRARWMEMSFSPIESTLETQRVVWKIIRGEYEEIVREAEDSNRRTRKYLVATDLSGEAQHALEWTIGTVLRDRDTLIAIYAIDQDTVENGGKIVSGDGIAKTYLLYWRHPGVSVIPFSTGAFFLSCKRDQKKKKKNLENSANRLPFLLSSFLFFLHLLSLPHLSRTPSTTITSSDDDHRDLTDSESSKILPASLHSISTNPAATAETLSRRAAICLRTRRVRLSQSF